MFLPETSTGTSLQVKRRRDTPCQTRMDVLQGIALRKQSFMGYSKSWREMLSSSMPATTFVHPTLMWLLPSGTSTYRIFWNNWSVTSESSWGSSFWRSILRYPHLRVCSWTNAQGAQLWDMERTSILKQLCSAQYSRCSRHVPLFRKLGAAIHDLRGQRELVFHAWNTCGNRAAKRSHLQTLTICPLATYLRM